MTMVLVHPTPVDIAFILLCQNLQQNREQLRPEKYTKRVGQKNTQIHKFNVRE